jgi:hypothetical protein
VEVGDTCFEKHNDEDPEDKVYVEQYSFMRAILIFQRISHAFLLRLQNIIQGTICKIFRVSYPTSPAFRKWQQR